MRKSISGLTAIAIVIAISMVLVVKAKPSLVVPTCPNGTALFYFKLDSRLYSPGALISEMRTPNNWTRMPINNESDCDGVARVCAICAVIANPGSSILNQYPSFNDFSIHTIWLKNKIEEYATYQGEYWDDSQPGYIYERD